MRAVLLLVVVAALVAIQSCRSSHRCRHSSLDVSVMSAAHVRWEYWSAPADSAWPVQARNGLIINSDSVFK